MKKFPNIKWTDGPSAQEERLERWLREWTLHNECRPEPQPRPESRPPQGEVIKDAKDCIAAFDHEDIVPGEVRLLSSRLLPDVDEPRYVIVLDAWDSGLMLVAPFSRFGTAATAGELETQRDKCHPLRVISLWNTHSAPRHLLCQSWLVDSFEKSEHEDALAVFRHVMTGKALPQHLTLRIGPPITEGYDPRIAYQMEEAGIFKPLADAAQLQVEGKVIYVNFAAERRAMQAKRAAGTTAARRKTHSFTVGETSLSLRVSLDADLATVVLAVRDAAGERSQALNDHVLLDSSGKQVAVFEDGAARVAASVVQDGFSLATAAGHVLALHEKHR